VRFPLSPLPPPCPPARLPALTALPLAAQGVLEVPQQQVFVVEKWGKYSGQLEAGLHFRPPVMYRVAYAHSLKETAMHVEPQDAITHAPPFPQPPPARSRPQG